MTRFLIEGGYHGVLTWHLAALAGLSAWAILGCIRGLNRAGLAILLGLLLLGTLAAGDLGARPAVYYDEFFYVAIAENMATSGTAEPLLYQGVPAQVLPLGHFQPPYPQGWPYLLSLALDPVGPPQPGRIEVPAWERVLPVSRVLWAALAPLLFLALAPRFSLSVAAASAMVLPMLAFVLRLAGSAAAENGSLFFLVLSWLALERFRREPGSLHLGWLVLSVCALAEMRPENLLYVLFFLGMAGRGIGQVRGVARVVWLVLGGGLLLPPVLVLMGHDPSLAHHFEVVPRGGFTLWGNRLANLFNNALYFLVHRIWPVGLTVLALVGLSWLASSSSRRVALLGLGWIGGSTLLLSWLPFGDYGAVNSLDTWRFGHHVALPGVLAAAAGAETLVRRGGTARVVAGLLFLWVILAPWMNRAFMTASHPLLRQDGLVETLRSELGNGIAVVEAPEYFCYLRYRHGLPATLAPISALPEGGAVLFSVEEGAGLPDLESWKAFDLEPLALDQELRPPAALFRLRPGSAGAEGGNGRRVGEGSGSPE